MTSPAKGRVRGAAQRRRPTGPRFGLSSPWVFIAPALLAYIGFLIWPAIQSIGLSFTDSNGIDANPAFVGLQNYIQLGADPTVQVALRNNAIWSGVTIVVPIVLGLVLATLLNNSSRITPLLRTIFYLPAVLPLVSVAAIWGWLYDPSNGSVNAILKAVGLGAFAQPWLGQDSTALWAAIVPAIWVRSGFPMLLYLAALQGIPQELHESAKTDGANAWQRFWNVTMPGLRPAHLIVLALSIIDSFKVFDLIFAMTNGGPGNATQVLGTWMYFNVFQYFHAGYGTAIAVVITLVALLFGVPYVITQIRNEDS